MSKSKSSSSSSTDQAQTTLSADGVVTGKVFNVSTKGNTTGGISFIDQFPNAVAGIMTQLIDAATGAGELAAKAYEKGLAAQQSTTSLAVQAAQQATQPDLEIVKKQTDFTPIIVIAAMATIILVMRK